ncbi:MAG: Binding-protein-dependent transport systems inner membrane component [Acetothermia bacterium 64_32]|nr:MAG: Binding-protein-dependent transport systems inner membrane component [Acetothermia bacterium 64_32]HAF70209.1 ABC transporter permease [Candidatus Acetothermia bacterium]
MQLFKRYFLPRLVQYLLVTFLGINAAFFIPRLFPSDPVLETIGAIRSQGTYLDPATVEEFIEDLRELYGLEGTLGQQYTSFWKRLFRGDLGISLFQFPEPVLGLIGKALPWTVGLLLTSTLASWLLGLMVGGIAGYRPDRPWVRALDALSMLIRPLPYYIFAFLLLILFAYVLPWFPLGGGSSIGWRPEPSLRFLGDLARHAFLPFLSLTVLGTASMYQMTKLVVQNLNAEEFVQYAQLGGVKGRVIIFKYVLRNAMLPLFTNLVLSLGQIFGGALITEIVFSYPGLGTLTYHAVVSGDYNLILGVTTISVVAVTTGILFSDLVYPLLDPRVRYR